MALTTPENLKILKTETALRGTLVIRCALLRPAKRLRRPLSVPDRAVSVFEIFRFSGVVKALISQKPSKFKPQTSFQGWWSTISGVAGVVAKTALTRFFKLRHSILKKKKQNASISPATNPETVSFF